jgi:glycosyltransferase involved in cell wall biosynthesis
MPYEVRDGIAIHRPAYFQIPRLGSAYWVDRGAFFWCRRTARELHRRVGFDAIISFDLLGAGGLAWRLGYELGIPASGWATGGDMRQAPGSRLERVVSQAIERLDTVFYQSRELFQVAGRLLKTSPEMMLKEKHVVLSRGIPAPPSLPKTEVRKRLRRELGLTEDQIVVLITGRVLRQKGIFELLDAVSLAVAKDPRIVCVSVGSNPAFDETTDVQKKLNQTPHVKERVRLLPSCRPDRVWEYLCAADIFAFPSHKEGMPNSLLEAMVMGVPSIAFRIPPVLEIEAGSGCLVAVPPLDPKLLADAILRLAACPDERARVGQKGKAIVMERYMVNKSMAEALRRIAQVVRSRK